MTSCFLRGCIWRLLKDDRAFYVRGARSHCYCLPSLLLEMIKLCMRLCLYTSFNFQSRRSRRYELVGPMKHSEKRKSLEFSCTWSYLRWWNTFSHLTITMTLRFWRCLMDPPSRSVSWVLTQGETKYNYAFSLLWMLYHWILWEMYTLFCLDQLVTLFRLIRALHFSNTIRSINRVCVKSLSTCSQWLDLRAIARKWGMFGFRRWNGSSLG